MALRGAALLLLLCSASLAEYNRLMHEGSNVLAPAVEVEEGPRARRAWAESRYWPGLTREPDPRDMAALLGADPSDPNITAALERPMRKLLRGESIPVFFMGESVTRGEGASHGLANSSCRGAHSAASAAGLAGTECAFSLPPAEAGEVETFRCNEWVCLVMSWFAHHFPGQVEWTRSESVTQRDAECYGELEREQRSGHVRSAPPPGPQPSCACFS